MTSCTPRVIRAPPNSYPSMSLASVCQGYPSTGSCELEQPAFAVMDRAMPLAVVIMAGDLAESSVRSVDAVNGELSSRR